MTTIYCIRPRGFNIGNEAIFYGLRRLLAVHLGEAVNVVSIPATPLHESDNRGGLTPRTIHELNQSADGVVVGGGNLYENNELAVDVEGLKHLRPPLMLYSLSRGRIYGRNNELIERSDVMPDRIVAALNEAATVSVARDMATSAHLERLGFKSILGACGTLFLDRLQKEGSVARSSPSYALLSVRNPELMNIPLAAQARVWEDIRQIAHLLRTKGYERVLLVCHDRRDIRFAASFEDVDYFYTEDIHEFFSMLSSASLSITYRLHSFLPCLSFGTPAINISYDERAQNLVETIGMKGWDIDLMGRQVVAEVEDRVDRTSEFTSVCHDAAPIWDDLFDSMSQAFGMFADAVRTGSPTPH